MPSAYTRITSALTAKWRSTEDQEHGPGEILTLTNTEVIELLNADGHSVISHKTPPGIGRSHFERFTLVADQLWCKYDHGQWVLTSDPPPRRDARIYTQSAFVIGGPEAKPQAELSSIHELVESLAVSRAELVAGFVLGKLSDAIKAAERRQHNARGISERAREDGAARALLALEVELRGSLTYDARPFVRGGDDGGAD